jgi:hemerythrin-like metal-binding protein
MNLIDWTEKELCGVKVIDEQHIRIVEIANELHQNLGSDRKWKMESLVKDLIETSKDHFETEEKLMTKYKFLHFYSHKLEHDSFMNKLYSFKQSFDNGSKDVNLKFLQTVKNWMINHLELNDRKCCVYLIEKGVS